MAEEVKSNFSNEVVEPTELEKHIERLQKHTIPMKPEMLNLIQTLVNQHLASGNVKPTELDALVFARDEVNKATIDYQTHLERMNKRTQELQAEQMESNRSAAEELRAEQRSILTEERVARKRAESLSNELQAEIDRLKSELENVHQVPKEKTRAMEMARAMNPIPTSKEAFDQKVADTKKSFKEWEEENGQPSNDDLSELMKEANDILDEDENFEDSADFYNGVSPEQALEDVNEKFEDTLESLEDVELEVPEDAKGTEDFFAEVEAVQERVDSDFSSSAPVISNSQLPDIKTYDSEEDLQAHIDEKNANVEDEYEEVTIPSESELQAMTKKQIHETAQSLSFDDVTTSMTKSVMIETFVKSTNDYIDSLKESGEFVSAETTDSSESSPNEDDRQDGGYF
tara:strand:+ start:6246 stop:7448 length:1203 start_codon:yes stop_codon:yes gene_type:complete